MKTEIAFSIERGGILFCKILT